jgi:hypothetical protein
MKNMKPILWLAPVFFAANVIVDRFDLHRGLRPQYPKTWAEVQSDLPFLLGISLAMALLGALLYGRNKKNRDTE